MMEIYGLTLLTNQELRSLNIQIASTGMFSDLFRLMERTPSPEYADGLRMTASEKDVSFLNRYFIFKKTTNPTAETVANSFIRPVQEDETINPIAVSGPEEEEEIVRPLHRVIELKSATNVEEEPTVAQTKKITDKSVKKPRTKKAELVVEPSIAELEVEPIVPIKTVKPRTKKVVAFEPPPIVEQVEPTQKPTKRASKKVVKEVKEGVEEKPKRKYTKKSI
jgi:hypothetical protein